MKPNTGDKVLWAELFPYEFKKRLADCPIVYLPLGICEPHGQVCAFGLDTFKAEWLCREAATKMGGIVAPSLGYHVHETGYHARWLEEEVGEENPHMTALPPDVMLLFFLYQLRTFVNAGFKSIIVISGHSGGNQRDLRLAAEIFMKYIPINVWIRSDPELVDDLFEGDHAGKYEISQLMFIRPDLIDMELEKLEATPGSGGRLALSNDAKEATPERGKEIMEACLLRICSEVSRMKKESTLAPVLPVSHTQVNEIWNEVVQRVCEWVTTKPWPGQKEVTSNSQWKSSEVYRVSSNET